MMQKMPTEIVRLCALVVATSMGLALSMPVMADEPASGRGERAAPESTEDGDGDGADAADEEADPEDLEADSRTVREGGEEVTEYDFSSIDIEGRNKAPHLLLFQARIRAEFDRPRLPHRSFLPELLRTEEADALR